MTSRVEQLRSEMTAALAEAEAQEAYEAAHQQFLERPDDQAAIVGRREAAESLRAVRAQLREQRGPVAGAAAPTAVTATTKMKRG
jgi:hypothetical protein